MKIILISISSLLLLCLSGCAEKSNLPKARSDYYEVKANQEKLVSDSWHALSYDSKEYDRRAFYFESGYLKGLEEAVEDNE